MSNKWRANPAKQEAFRPWKPDACADCGAPHPCLTKDGMAGPWRCAPCDAVASPKPKADKIGPLL